MNRKYKLAIVTLSLALSLFAAAPASAQVQLLSVQQDVPMAATLDNPCTVAPEAIAFTGTTHIDQQVWLMPGGTTRLVVSETTSLSGTDTLLGAASPIYQVSGCDSIDVEFNPGAATLYNYKQVTNSASQDNFHVIVQLDFDPSSLRLTPGLQASCSDGSPSSP